MRPQRKFRSKFIAVTAIGIVVGLLANVWVASTSLDALGSESANALETGLRQTSQEYLTNYIVDAATRIHAQFRQGMAETKILADIVQTFVDQGRALDPLYQILPTLPMFDDEMRYDPRGWTQNLPGEPTVVSVWGSSLNPDGSIPERTREYIRKTEILDLIMPAISANGTSKSLTYFVSPDEASMARLAPYVDIGTGLDMTDKERGHYQTPFWEFYFKGIVDTWKTWPTQKPWHIEEYVNPKAKPEMRQIVVAPAYEDAAGEGQVITFFHPVWSPDRQTFYGGVGVDVLINQIIDDIESLALGKSGFAFLAQSNGNIVAIPQEGLDILKLPELTERPPEGMGLALLKQSFKNSKSPVVAALELPEDAAVHHQEIIIDGASYVLVMRRMAEFPLWHRDQAPYVRPAAWTLGFVVPTEEIYSAMIASQAAIERSTQSIRMQQFIIMLATLIIVLTGVYWLSQRMTTDLVALSDAASRMMRKDYDVRVSVNTQDEVGYLGTAFNEMASEIRTYTKNLESLVEQRTSELKHANEEIRQLNGRLEQENLRLAAEIDVARRLQSMVLPQPEELERVEGLDIDGYMKPADEVGGDYYDVLQGPNGIKLGMGDVTGHGLESGVLMLMVQTAVRTLLASGERDPVRFLNLVNQAVYLNNQRMAVDRNLSLCLLDYKDGILTITGQHEDVIVIRADGSLECIDTTDLGFPLGLKLDIYDLSSHSQVTLQAGDVVILYTDGITEAENAEGVHYGMERLCAVAVPLRDKSAKDIRKAIIADVSQHIGEQEVFDDITLLVIKKA